MKPLSERDENSNSLNKKLTSSLSVGMKPLSERDENYIISFFHEQTLYNCRNEATL